MNPNKSVSMHKIYLGPHEVAGYLSGLSQGFRTLGLPVTYNTIFSNKYLYEGEDYSRTCSLIRKFELHQTSISSRPLRRVLKGIIRILRIYYFLTMLFKHDVFIFIFGISLLKNNKDLPIYKFFNKVVIFHMGMGSESRPPYVNGTQIRLNEDRIKATQRMVLLSKKKRNSLAFIEKNATVIIGAPLSTSAFASKRMINHFCIGLPVRKIEKIFQNSTKEYSEIVEILHAPSNPVAKGSDVIKKVINELKAEGLKIHLTEIVNRPNREVLEAISNSDLIVDQLYSDTPMAVFATEAAGFGKPSVVAGYGFELLDQFIPTDMLPPSYICRPDQIKEAIKTLVVNKKLRQSMGRQAKDFVDSKWTAEEVARKYMYIIEGEVPTTWWFDPESINYPYGAGISKEAIIDNIRAIVSEFGVSGLGLSGRPELEQEYLKIAGIST